MNTISLDVSSTDNAIIQKIADRVLILYPYYNYLQLVMDITACHGNGNPLDLERLLLADDANFFHDVAGIAQHIDRETGKMLHCFSPRYSKKA